MLRIRSQVSESGSRIRLVTRGARLPDGVGGLHRPRLLIWGLSLQELRVVDIVWTTRRRGGEKNAGAELAGEGSA